MSVTSGFFDSVDGDRTYDADQMSTYFEGLISDGIYENIGNRFAVNAGTGMTVTVGSGRALIDSHWIKSDAQVTLVLNPADVQLDRIDAIALRLDRNERNITIVVKTGTPSLSPQAPLISRTQNVYELYLAYVYIGRSITRITDLRSSSLCGWVTGIIKQVNTSDLFDQWETAYENYYYRSTNEFDAYMQAKKAEFETWFESLTEELRVDTYIEKQQTSYQITQTRLDRGTFPIPNYSERDVLFVIVDGVMMVNGVDFNIAESSEFPDIDSSGQITNTDANSAGLIAGGYAEEYGLGYEAKMLADVDADGMVTIEDQGRISTFVQRVSQGGYTNDLAGWKSYLSNVLPSKTYPNYFIIPTGNAFRAGRQLTIIVLKSKIGEG